MGDFSISFSFSDLEFVKWSIVFLSSIVLILTYMVSALANKLISLRKTIEIQQNIDIVKYSDLEDQVRYLDRWRESRDERFKEQEHVNEKLKCVESELASTSKNLNRMIGDYDNLLERLKNIKLSF